MRWQKSAARKLTELMCFAKKRVKPAIQTAGKVDCGSYVREHFYFKSEEGFWVPAFLFIPKSAKANRSSRAMLSLHGHGQGKTDVAGIHETTEEAGAIDALQYAYSHQFAENGYVVASIDSRAFGELGDLTCWAAYALANTLGRPLVGMRVWDAMRALDILAARKEVDPKRIGCTGLSWGGTHTAYVTMLDRRIKAALVSGYFSTFEDMLYREPACTCQYLPKVAERFDFPELLFGLTCPRPLYIQNGIRDPLYTPAEVKKGFARGRRIYKAAGAEGNAHLEIHDGAHEYRFEPALAWFNKVL
jgi:dienelactone hydrolase